MIFGALYGLSTIALYALLRAAGLPAFYDKLLQVPLLNLSIQSIDRAVRSGPLRRWDPGLIWPSLSGVSRNIAYISAWAIVFAVMTAAQGVGDRHRGQWIPFWQRACEQGRGDACRYLAVLYTNYCSAGSGWSCTELARLQAGPAMDRRAATLPPLEELPILLRGSKGPITDRSAASLYRRACEQGWAESCNHSGKSNPPPADSDARP
jgi:hypothetical protein